MNEQAEALKARAAAFATEIIDLCSKVPQTDAGRTITRQLTEAATSVSANYRATCRARSRREFIAKLGVVVEEADESLGWLELLVSAKLLTEQQAAHAIQEADELTAIFTASLKTAKRREMASRIGRQSTRSPASK